MVKNPSAIEPWFNSWVGTIRWRRDRLLTNISSALIKRIFSPFDSRLDFPGGSDGKVSAYNAGDPSSIPGPGRFLGEGNGNPLQYSYLENPCTEEHGRLQSMGLPRVGHD